MLHSPPPYTVCESSGETVPLGDEGDVGVLSSVLFPAGTRVGAQFRFSPAQRTAAPAQAWAFDPVCRACRTGRHGEWERAHFSLGNTNGFGAVTLPSGTMRFLHATSPSAARCCQLPMQNAVTSRSHSSRSCGPAHVSWPRHDLGLVTPCTRP